VSKSVLDVIKKMEDRVSYNTYESVAIRKEKEFNLEMEKALEFISKDFYGIEIDLDAIPNIPSSAMTISGYSIEQLRQFISYFAKNKNASYLHICEGAPDLGEQKNNNLVGKLIGYLITDFIKSNSVIQD
jgi:formiminoglutamase